jgi:hypothetical protein
MSESEEVGNRFKDVIPSTFLPNNRQYKDLVIEKAVAETSRNARLQALYWLKSGDVLAKENASNLIDPLAVSIHCCRSPVNDPTIFWNERKESLIHFSENRMLVPRRAANSLQPHFVPRSNEAIITEVPNDKLYALFMKVCYRGDRIGYSHEPDINHICNWCGFEFGKPYSIMDIPAEAVKAVQTNKITADPEAFQALLDKVHINNNVEMPILTMDDATTLKSMAIADFETMDPPPIPNWNTLFHNIMEELKKLVNKEGNLGLSLGEIMGTLTNFTSSMKNDVKEKYSAKTKDNRDILLGFDIIVGLSWTNFIQVLETYFLKPCQNIYFNYKVTTPQSFMNDKWAKEHMEDIQKAITIDRSINVKYSELAENTNGNRLAKEKLETFIKQMSVLISFRNRINPSYFIGRDQTFAWFKEVFLYGPLATLYDPEIGYDGDPSVSKKAVSEIIPEMIGTTILNFMKQRVTYDDEQVKLIIADSCEKEKQVMLSNFKKLTEDQRRVEQINKVLKIGRFAIGADWRKFAQYSAGEYMRRTGEINEMEQWGSLSGETPATYRRESSGYNHTPGGFTEGED